MEFNPLQCTGKVCDKVCDKVDQRREQISSDCQWLADVSSQAQWPAQIRRLRRENCGAKQTVHSKRREKLSLCCVGGLNSHESWRAGWHERCALSITESIVVLLPQPAVTAADDDNKDAPRRPRHQSAAT